jgi:hypothetical protein
VAKRSSKPPATKPAPSNLTKGVLLFVASKLFAGAMMKVGGWLAAILLGLVG